MLAPPASSLPGSVLPSDPGTPFTAADGRTYQVWGNRGDNATVFLYRAPAGDTSLRRFDYLRVLFSGGYAPPQFCQAYGPFDNSSCETAYRASVVECPDYMVLDRSNQQHLLIGSLGLGGYKSLPATAWWAGKWKPGESFQPTTQGILDFGSFCKIVILSRIACCPSR